MTKTSLAVLALGAAATTAVLAQEPAAPAPAGQTPPAAAAPAAAPMRPPRIAIIDLNAVSSQSLLGKSYAGRIEALENEIKTEGNKKQAELQKMDAAVKTLQDELEKQAAVLSPEAADRKRQEITRKTRERQAFLEDGQAELQRMRERAQAQAEALNNEFQQKLKPHIDAVAKEKGIDIILTSQVALTINPQFDISRDVIAKADAAERAATAAPRPAASPAAADIKPAAAPSPKP